MEPVIIAVLVSISVYVGIIALIPPRMLAESVTASAGAGDPGSILREHIQKSGLLGRAFFTLPGVRSFYPSLLKAGLADQLGVFFTALLVLFILLMFMLRSGGAIGLAAAFCITCLVAWFFIRWRIKKRNQIFLNLFPDALDMIVRSVRSGYPLNAAVRMVSENMQPPVSIEFKQVADEAAYGSSLIDALHRLSFRVDEPDIRFFVVVLAVQQEVGGNLAEVLSNLATIIRKRRHLRLKIKAMTSEGRATAWVLGLLPLFEFIAIYLVAPTHLTPLFDTHLGNLILASAIGIVLLGAFIVRQLINIEV